MPTVRHPILAIIGWSAAFVMACIVATVVGGWVLVWLMNQ